MFPWGHLAFGYVAYTLFNRLYFDSFPDGPPVIVLGITALLPDLVDKPLSWSLGIFPSGRALFHSLLVLLPLSAAIYWLSHRTHRASIGHSAIIGLLSHAVGDILDTLFTEPLYDIPIWLLWPLLSVPTDENAGYHYLWEISADPFFYFETSLTVFAIALWFRHGVPGIDWLANSVSD